MTYNKSYYTANKAKLNANSRQWYSKNKEAQKETNRIWYTTTQNDPLIRAGYMMRSAQMRAKRSRIPFDLTVEDILPVLKAGICEATGLPFVFSRNEGRSPFSPSLDRLKLTDGYVRGNTRVILWALNAACGDWGEDVLLQIVRARLAYMI